ncbi:hypothetical protein [Shinella sp. HZN7]|uniref:hypothetical protein n=1 Tax=Shinella sp. (strain HZN7) TaxID=879274 RepID=UPI000AFBD45D|nr:hypothetical protein [Shinella sp. HZN7]
MASIVADIGGQTYYAWVTTSFVVSAIVALLFALLAQRAFAGMGGSPHRTPVPVASLVPLVLATIAISLSAIVPIGWSTLATVGAGLALLVLFVLVERRAHNTIPAAYHLPARQCAEMGLSHHRRAQRRRHGGDLYPALQPAARRRRPAGRRPARASALPDPCSALPP